MQTTATAAGHVSYTVRGSGPPLVLVHGAFSDHESNWTAVIQELQRHARVYAVARRGRGMTEATVGHTLEDEAQDVLAVMRAAGEPVAVLGHSYGAHCALLAAACEPQLVTKLVLYEPAWPHLLRNALAALQALAAAGAWEQFAYAFFANVLKVPGEDLDALRDSPDWLTIVADGRASLEDLQALRAYDFDAERFRDLHVPVLLQVGSESPPEFYVTDALAAVLPDVRVETLAGQAHEGMTTAPAQYQESVLRFLHADTRTAVAAGGQRSDRPPVCTGIAD
jgi:pimeloyl-ACP methyl ester carboxylesterase